MMASSIFLIRPDMKEEVAKELLEKVRRDYDAIADDFSASRDKPWPETERFRAFVSHGDHVLDIGCGNGRAYQLFKDAAIEYEGVDVSERLVRIAKDRIREMLAQFHVGSMLALPFGEGEFDAAFAVAVLHHVPSREYRLRALREAWRVLRPGGRLVMTNWDLLSPKRFPAVASAAMANLLRGMPHDAGDVFVRWGARGADVRRYYHAFTLRGLRRLCRDAGFVVEEGYRAGGNLVVVCRKPDRQPSP